ncbi:hypothetical protein EDD11_004507 [Mortierella claussenii]|nr:hypothetical protein EDD11_004507 [Mortierella claussenii]
MSPATTVGSSPVSLSPPSRNRSPLDLPELLLQIASYLYAHDLTVCLRVCKAWQASIAPCAWKDIRICTNPGNKLHPSTQSVLKHTLLIRRLTIYEAILRDQALIHCPALESLCLTLCQRPGRADMPGEDESSRETTMILNHPSITRLALSSVIVHDNHALWAAVSDLPRLKALFFSYSTALASFADIFWQACTHPELLSLTYAEVPNVPSTAKYSFNWIRHLVLKWVRGGLSPLMQVQFMLSCTELESLVWEGSPENLPLHDLCKRAAQHQPWPYLTALSLEHTKVKDEDLCQLLRSLSSVKKLQLKSTGFGPLSLQELSRHFSMLEHLDVDECCWMTSLMACTIMNSCPNLLSFKAPVIRGVDIINGTRDDGSYSPWICTKLRELNVYIDMDGLDSQEDMLERLSTLQQLESFNFGRKKYIGRNAYTSIELRLDKGLATLATLRRLQDLRFDDVDQELTHADVRWIEEHWKCLRLIEGRLSKSTAVHSELKQIFSNCRVHASWDDELWE